MKYVSGWIMWGIYTGLGCSGEVAEPIGSTTSYWLCHFPASTQPGINTPHNPSTDILHSPAYEDGTDSEFRIGSSTYYWLCHFPARTQPGINIPHNPSTDILHSPAYEDETDSEFRNVGN